MKLFFGEIIPDVKINDEEQQHIVKVLRMKEGEEIFVTDGKGNLAKGNLVFELTRQLHIAIAPTKNIDRIEFFVEKATEMGISEITILNTEKTERKNLNIDKLRKQAVAASKQSLRFFFPKINDITKLSDFIKNVNPEMTFVAHCDVAFERINLSEIPELTNPTFLIGPEGDFSEKEIKMLAEKGIKAVSLGHQRLRTETAGIFVTAWNYEKMI